MDIGNIDLIVKDYPGWVFTEVGKYQVGEKKQNAIFCVCSGTSEQIEILQIQNEGIILCIVILYQQLQGKKLECVIYPD